MYRDLDRREERKTKQLNTWESGADVCVKKHVLTNRGRKKERQSEREMNSLRVYSFFGSLSLRELLYVHQRTDNHRLDKRENEDKKRKKSRVKTRKTLQREVSRLLARKHEREFKT